MDLLELEKITPGELTYDVRDQLKRHIYGRAEQAFAAGDAARDAINSVAALRARQRKLRKLFVQSLGGLPPGGDLKPRTVGTIPCDGFRIEKIIFQSRPGHYVTANLYLPEGLHNPRAAVLFVCGHHEQAKHVPEYQSVCQTLVKAGLIVLAQDPVGQGERLSYYDPHSKTTSVTWGIWEHEYAGAQCLPLGDGLGRYFLHDAMRGVDYLLTRPEVDPKSIGVTGNSGGGTQTSMMMLADPRIAAAAPCTFVMDRHSYVLCGGSQDAEQVWAGFSAAGFDHEDILLAMCPKPVRVLAVTWDFFPIEGTRRTVQRAQRLWKLCGRPAALDLVEDDSIHKYTPKLAHAAAEFFARHLLGRKSPLPPIETAPLEPSKLWCTRSGQVQGELRGARFVHDENRQRSHELSAGRKAMPEQRRRSEALTWLRGRVTAPRQACPLNPRFYSDITRGGLRIEHAFWWSQPGLFNHGALFRASERGDQNLPVTLALWDGGTTQMQRHSDWIMDQCRAGRAVLVLDVAGTGHLAPHPIMTWAHPQGFYGTMHKLADELIWLGDDLAALRTWDVLRAVEMIRNWRGIDARDIRGYAEGRPGVYLQLAAALDSRLRRIELVGGIRNWSELAESRHYDPLEIKSFILRGALQHFDLTDLKRMKAANKKPDHRRRSGPVPVLS